MIRFILHAVIKRVPMLCYGVMLSVNVTVISMSATACERIGFFCETLSQFS